MKKKVIRFYREMLNMKTGEIAAARGVKSVVLALWVALPDLAGAAPPLAEQLRQGAHGQPVLLVESADATLFARSSDGSYSKQLAGPNAFNPDYDAARELLWFSNEGTLFVLDFREPEAPAIPIVENLQGARICVRHAGEPERPARWELRLNWSRKPSIEALALTSDEIDVRGASPEEVHAENARVKAQAKGARIVGTPWLIKNFVRPLRPAVPQRRFNRRVRDEGLSGRRLGRAARFGASTWEVVVVEDTCDHDGCYLACQLYNPQSRLWAEVDHPTNWEEGSGSDSQTCSISFDASLKSYIARWHGPVCRVDGHCDDLAPGMTFQAWLDPGLQMIPPAPRSER